MTKLSVNLNAVAYLRNRRDVPWPDLTSMARLVLDAGAAGITVHPRLDERHIRRSDVKELTALLRDEYPAAEFNIEGYPTADFFSLVANAQPTQVTLVPDHPDQSTSDHGWDIEADKDFLRTETAKYRNLGCRVALFVDPVPHNADLAKTVGANRIELYTGPYGAAQDNQTIKSELELLATTAERANALEKLKVNAGLDLNAENLKTLTDRIPNIAEVSIGHGITTDALSVGFPEAVRMYLGAL